METETPTERNTMNTYEKLEKAEKDAEALLTETPEPEKEEVQEPVNEGIEEPVVEETVVVKDDTVPKPDKEEQTYKAKYETLKGKYDKETPLAIKEANAAKAEAQNLRDLNQKLMAQLEEISNQIAELKTEKLRRDSSLDELEVLHPEMAEVIRKRDELHEAEIKKLREEINRMVSSQIEPIKGELQESREEKFDRVLREAGVPEWREIDRDEKFFEWLEERVPYTNKKKLELLQEAAKDYRDPETCAQFFKDFKATVQTPPAENKEKKLEKFVAPSKSNVGTAPAKTDAPIFTEAQYKKFMKETTMGTFDPKNWWNKTEDQLDAMFHKAALEGRLRP